MILLCMILIFWGFVEDEIKPEKWWKIVKAVMILSCVLLLMLFAVQIAHSKGKQAAVEMYFTH